MRLRSTDILQCNQLIGYNRRIFDFDDTNASNMFTVANDFISIFTAAAL